jgi:TusA-related sulfurtransferase
MRAVPAGAEVEVLATDPGSVEDLRAFCAATGNKFLHFGHAGDGALQFRIRKE